MVSEKMADKLDGIFNAFVSNNLFKNKSVLQSNYTPETIPHRDEQIEAVASILAPALRGEKVSNLFCYGKTGTGKTLSVQHVGNRLLERVKSMGQDYLQFLYLNCKMKKVADTEYRIIAELISELGGSVPATGLPTDYVYSKFVDMIDSKKQTILLVLDEIDQAVKKISDNFIYTLTRMNSDLKRAQISIIGISNSLTFMDNLDPRVRSSLGEEELVFPPYNALQLQDILRERAEMAFKDGLLDDGVISKCAAYAAREHGDARRALDLLRVAGELAERSSHTKIRFEHIDEANQKIERDKMLDIIESEPKQFQLVLSSIMQLEKETKSIFTGDVYNIYQTICEKTKNEILTQRRVSDIIAEFDMLGIINARVISKGRQGRTREIKLMLSPSIKVKAEELLQQSLQL
ncbi:MAG TPA: orc1/cdc6 family replication initiation protein [Candidatus Nanoarchaeia archaeon]|nr:orc1/cdc6 family replication initiation protein [Candidatus Nanoarchaeia archaeon]